MQTYATNSQLGNGHLAYFIKLGKTKDGYNYLCIENENYHANDCIDFKIGEVYDIRDKFMWSEHFNYEECVFKNIFLNLDYIQLAMNANMF